MKQIFILILIFLIIIFTIHKNLNLHKHPRSIYEILDVSPFVNKNLLVDSNNFNRKCYTNIFQNLN